MLVNNLEQTRSDQSDLFHLQRSLDQAPTISTEYLRKVPH